PGLGPPKSQMVLVKPPPSSSSPSPPSSSPSPLSSSPSPVIPSPSPGIPSPSSSPVPSPPSSPASAPAPKPLATRPHPKIPGSETASAKGSNFVQAWSIMARWFPMHVSSWRCLRYPMGSGTCGPGSMSTPSKQTKAWESSQTDSMQQRIASSSSSPSQTSVM